MSNGAIIRFFLSCSCMLMLAFVRAGIKQEPMMQVVRDTGTVTHELVIATPGAGIATRENIPGNKSKEKDEKNPAGVNSKSLSAAPNLNDGLLDPKAMAFVQGYMDENKSRLEKMKSWGLPYFNLIDQVFGEHHIPKELKYLAVIESDLKSTASSWAGARGPWQFMPETGRRLGLRVSRNHDDRIDLYKSTHAAARYLSELYKSLDDWLLVIAAYNGGTARVLSAIKKSNSRDFWDLQYFLATESRNHVKKFIATHYIMEGKGGETTSVNNGDNGVPQVQFTAEEIANMDSAHISGKYNSGVLARNLGMDILEFDRYNPGFDKKVGLEGFTLRLPRDKMPLFEENKNGMLNESVQELLTEVSSEKTNVYPAEIKLAQPQKKKKPVKKGS